MMKHPRVRRVVSGLLVLLMLLLCAACGGSGGGTAPSGPMKTVTDIYLHLYQEDLEENKIKMENFFRPEEKTADVV